jgi:hypothetical protein
MQAILQRALEDSLVMRRARRFCAGSLVCTAAGALMRPSLSYLGGAVEPETEEQSRQTIERAWRIVLESVPGRLSERAIETCSRAWRHSRVAALYGAVLHFEPALRVAMLGWIVLAAVVASGVVKALAAEPWPGLSMLIWAAVAGAAGLLIVRPREVATAWQAFRGRR